MAGISVLIINLHQVLLKKIIVMGLNLEFVQEQDSIVRIPPYTIHFTI